jgi:hypothetical protein
MLYIKQDEFFNQESNPIKTFELELKTVIEIHVLFLNTLKYALIVWIIIGGFKEKYKQQSIRIIGAC